MPRGTTSKITTRARAFGLEVIAPTRSFHSVRLATPHDGFKTAAVRYLSCLLRGNSVQQHASQKIACSAPDDAETKKDECRQSRGNISPAAAWDSLNPIRVGKTDIDDRRHHDSCDQACKKKTDILRYVGICRSGKPETDHNRDCRGSSCKR